MHYSSMSVVLVFVFLHIHPHARSFAMAQRPLSRRHTWSAALFSAVLTCVLMLSFSGAAHAQSTNPAATIRFVNAISGGGPVDVILDGSPIAQGLAFGMATEYASLPAGDH